MPVANYNGNPAYQQFPQQAPRPKAKPATPAPAPAAPTRAPTYNPNQPTGPVPYPAASQLPGAQPPAPKAPDNAQLAQDIAALRKNDQAQDRRLENLERGQFQQPITHQPLPKANPTQQATRLTYVKHQVRSRESIYGIADHYGVTAEDIRKANNRRNDLLTTGETIYVPQRVPASQNSDYVTNFSTKKAPSTPKATGSTHIVARKETLSSIAAMYHVPVKSLQSANNIRNINVISLGQKLTIPGGTAPPVATSTKPTVKPDAKPGTEHFVAAPAKEPAKPAPTATVVKAPTATTPIPGAGVATGNIIKPTGQRGITSYRVEPGDNIDTVAKNYGTTPAEITRINRLGSPRLPAPGEEIVVPLPGSVAL
jgi:LysM repeat protein